MCTKPESKRHRGAVTQVHTSAPVGHAREPSSLRRLEAHVQGHAHTHLCVGVCVYVLHILKDSPGAGLALHRDGAHLKNTDMIYTMQYHLVFHVCLQGVNGISVGHLVPRPGSLGSGLQSSKSGLHCTWRLTPFQSSMLRGNPCPYSESGSAPSLRLGEQRPR